MSSELAYEASDEASESELLERSLSVWKGWNSIEWEDFDPTALDIHTACSIGQYDWVRSNILKGEEPSLDRRNNGGWTPLMYACYIGHDNIVNLLINAGCNMNMKNFRGHTPLMLAASCGNESVARTLVRKGADLELMDKTGWTALFHATYAGHQNFVAYLLEAGANKDAVEPSSGTTPFMEASAEGHEIIVQLLLQHGVNVNAKAHNGYMARSLALMNGHMKVVSLIDNHALPSSCLKTQSGLDINFNSSEEGLHRKHHPSAHNKRLKSKGPSIRDGPEAIARMIDRTRHTDLLAYPNLLVPKGYVSFPVSGTDKEDTKLSYRDVTSPINPEDYKDSSGSRALSDVDDFNDDSNAFTKTGAITIKSSSSSSGGLVAALGLSREDSLDSSDDSHSYDHSDISPKDTNEDSEMKGHLSTNNNSIGGDRLECVDHNIPPEHWNSLFLRNNHDDPINLKNHPLLSKTSINHRSSIQTFNIDNQNSEACITNNNEIIYPLKDYFPNEIPYQIRAAATTDIESSNSKEPFLPKDNMTQVEIVNRFLKNLTVNNPDTYTGQNRWADDSSDLTAGGGYHNESLQCNNHHGLFYEDSTSLTRNCPSLNHDCTNFKQQNYNNVKNQNVEPSTANVYDEKTSEISSPQQNEICSGIQKICSKDSTNIQTQSYQKSNHNHHHKNTHEHLSNQPWTHHPQLNHHHPLHNHHKHNHNSYSHPSDTSTHTALSVNSPPVVPLYNIPQSIINQLPQDFFYNDTDNVDQYHNQPTPKLLAHIPSEIIPEGNINSEIENAHLPLPHPQNPLLTNPFYDLHKNMELLIAESRSPSSQLQTGKVNKVASRNKTANHNLDQTEVKLPESHFTQQQQQPLPLSSPFTVSSSLAATTDENVQNMLQPRNILPQSSLQATVVIPGHATSQPVCSTIDWDLAGINESPCPQDLPEMLAQLGLSKYLDKFVEQDVDLLVFLSMTDNELKELGVKLFGPRKKMTNAIARWHSKAPIDRSSLEQAYADKLEGEMQEMAIQFNRACENEERLKAQVLQEQQLRSVTESCLLEVQASWEQACQILLSTKTKMCSMGDLMSRVRLCQKELRKLYEEMSKQLPSDSFNEDIRPFNVPGDALTDRVGNDGSVVDNAQVYTGKRDVNQLSSSWVTGREVFKKCEKYFKEMQQMLTGVVGSVEHLIKSTPNLSNIDKNRPQT